jgi:hypothetical protein
MTKQTTVEDAPILFTELALLKVRRVSSPETMSGKIREDIIKAMPEGYADHFVHVVQFDNEGEYHCSWDEGDILVDLVIWERVVMDKGRFAGKTVEIPHPASVNEDAEDEDGTYNLGGW